LLDLTVSKNSIFGFLGPNGAGKTTTIKLLLGLAKPTAGSATVFGHDIVHDNVEIRKRVGYLAQDPRYYEYMTARPDTALHGALLLRRSGERNRGACNPNARTCRLER
jgi:ABC-type multidrug transport system ATPase subunit